MASRHKGRHKPRHHTHKVKPSHQQHTALPPLPTQDADAVNATASTAAVADEQTQSETLSAAPVAAE